MIGTILLIGATLNPLILPPFTFAGRVTDYAHCAYDQDQMVEIRAKTTDGKLIAKTTTATGGKSAYNYVLEIPLASAAVQGYVRTGDQLVFEFADPDGVVYERLVSTDDAKVGRPGELRELNIALAKDDNHDGIPDEYVDWLAYLMWLNEKADYEPDADWDEDGANNRAEYVAGTNPFDPTDRLSVKEMAEEQGYEGYLKFTFLANQGRSYTVDTIEKIENGKLTIENGGWRPAKFIDAADGVEKGRLNTSSTKAADYRVIYVLKENLQQQFWKLKVE